MRTLLATILLLPALALAQATPQVKMKDAPKIAAPKSPAKKAESEQNLQTQALDEATRMESRKFEATSKASKKRHEQAPNAKRNER
jgi:hypothetical protein